MGPSSHASSTRFCPSRAEVSFQLRRCHRDGCGAGCGADCHDDAGSTPFVLTAIGLALTLGGNAAVSNRIAEPNYDRMLAWDPNRMPDDWQGDRRFYFKLNWIRAASTWTAFGLFLAALVVEL